MKTSNKKPLYRRTYKEILLRRGLAAVIIIALLFGLTALIGTGILRKRMSSDYWSKRCDMVNRLMQETGVEGGIDVNKVRLAMCLFADSMLDNGPELYAALVDTKTREIVCDSEMRMFIVGSGEGSKIRVLSCPVEEFEPYFSEQYYDTQGASQFQNIVNRNCRGRVGVLDYYTNGEDFVPATIVYRNRETSFLQGIKSNESEDFVFADIDGAVSLQNYEYADKDGWVFVSEEQASLTDSAHEFCGTSPYTSFIETARTVAIESDNSAYDNPFTRSISSLNKYAGFAAFALTASDGREYEVYTCFYCDNLFAKINIYMYVFLVSYIVIGLAVVLVSSAVTARKNKYRCATEDYRKDLMHDMAADLTAPLSKLEADARSLSAAVTGSSSGTSYKAEAARIGDDVKEMNRIINDVLTRSEDEYGTAVRKAGKKR